VVAEVVLAEVLIKVTEKGKAREWTWAGAVAREVAVDMELLAEDTVAEAMEEEEEEEDMVVEAAATEPTEARAEDTA